MWLDYSELVLGEVQWLSFPVLYIYSSGKKTQTCTGSEGQEETRKSLQDTMLGYALFIGVKFNPASSSIISLINYFVWILRHKLSVFYNFPD